MATTRRLRSSAASPAPSCTTTPSWQSPASWAMGSGSERASSRNFNPTICSRTGSAGRARATTKARSRDWSASSGGTSWSPSRGPRASGPQRCSRGTVPPAPGGAAAGSQGDHRRAPRTGPGSLLASTPGTIRCLRQAPWTGEFAVAGALPQQRLFRARGLRPP